MLSLLRFLPGLLLVAAPASSAVDLTPGAAPTPGRLQAGETVRYELRSADARRLTLALRDLVFDPESAAGVAVRVRRADGTSVGADWTHCIAARARPACVIELAADAGGRYVIDLDAPFSAGVRFSFGAAGIPSWPAPGALANTAPVVLKEPQRFDIEIKAGEQVTVGLAKVQHQPAPGMIGAPYVSVLNADGSQRKGVACLANMPACKLSLDGLAPGTHTIQVRPSLGGTLTATPYRSLDAVVKVGDGTQTVKVATASPGQIIRLEFTAEQGKQISVNVSDLRREGLPTFLLVRPDGQPASRRMLLPAETSADIAAQATSTGVHTLVVDPGASEFSATVTVKR